MESPLIPAMEPYASTIFSEMSALAARTGAVNLGQGFPDAEGPAFLVEAACRAIREGHNQYAPRSGVPELRRAIADRSAHESEGRLANRPASSARSTRTNTR